MVRDDGTTTSQPLPIVAVAAPAAILHGPPVLASRKRLMDFDRGKRYPL
jgi:hypothetical protein